MIGRASVRKHDACEGLIRRAYAPTLANELKMIRITHLDHVSLIVTDVSRSREFYGGILGLKEIAPPASFTFVAVWYDLGGQSLHLLQKTAADSISARHPCFHVADIAAARAHVLAHGLAIEETVTIPGCDRFFVRDPDGNRIEILNWQRPYDSGRDGRFAVISSVPRS
jgi:catechol 2,3-dioxygenase-like lactoylglutathione lyase family enzyme